MVYYVQDVKKALDHQSIPMISVACCVILQELNALHYCSREVCCNFVYTADFILL